MAIMANSYFISIFLLLFSVWYFIYGILKMALIPGLLFYLYPSPIIFSHYLYSWFIYGNLVHKCLYFTITDINY